MNRNLTLALVCALSFAAVSCNNKPSQEPEISRGGAPEKVEQLPDGVFLDEAVVMNSDYKGENLLLIKSEKDVQASVGKILLKGDDAAALFEQLKTQKVRVAADETHDSGWKKSTQGWTCVQQAQLNKIHPEADGFITDSSCELDINYASGKWIPNQEQVLGPALISTWWGDISLEAKPLEKNYRGDALTLVSGEASQQKAWVKLSGSDARMLWYGMSAQEAPAKAFEESTGIVEKSTGDITCNKTPVALGVMFDCYVYFNFSTGGLASSAE